MPNFDVPAAGSQSARKRAERKDGAQLTIASVGDRMIALMFDRLLIAAVLLVLVAWATEAKYKLPSSPWAAAAVAAGAIFLVTFLYHFVCEVALLTTVGKAAMGLHVGLEEGHSRVGGIALRNLLRLVDGIGFYLVGFLFATFSLRRQRIGDRVGHTNVVEWPIARGGRAAVMFLLIAIAAAAVWISTAICPSCAQLTQQLSALRPG
ncbi:MAG TPA: RDD family protein [Thermoanaerobaculia bacterium]